MSQISGTRGPFLRVQAGAADAEGRPVTPVAPVPTSRRFAQSPRTIAPRGRPVTSAGPAPPRPPLVRARCAFARARAPVPPTGPPLGAPSPAWLVDAAGTSYCRSSASSPPRAPADTSSDTRSSDAAALCAWASSLDACRGTPPSRLLDLIPGDQVREVDLQTTAGWISLTPPPKGKRAFHRLKVLSGACVEALKAMRR